METFEETSRITNVSATMFPSLPRAIELVFLVHAVYTINFSLDFDVLE